MSCQAQERNGGGRSRPAFSFASAAELPQHSALVHSRSTLSALPWQPTLLALPMPMAIRQTPSSQCHTCMLCESQAESGRICSRQAVQAGPTKQGRQVARGCRALSRSLSATFAYLL
jgi:hypothetical protein